MNSRYFSDESEKLVYLKRGDNGDYVHDLTYNAFNWWCKSRAALVVELPENCKGMALTVDELRSMLDKIGVTLK